MHKLDQSEYWYTQIYPNRNSTILEVGFSTLGSNPHGLWLHNKLMVLDKARKSIKSIKALNKYVCVTSEKGTRSKDIKHAIKNGNR